ncbi:MAG TPA: hypothetical protein VEA99_04885 [Gemmatimonadaceae bacterium]|nr:hypothetical protein [Gemmatimonadaceae bacterium]
MDTAATAEGHASLRGRTLFVDLAEFARMSGGREDPAPRLPTHMRTYRASETTLCPTARPCESFGLALVRTHRVKRQSDGSLLIAGGIHFLSPAPRKSESERTVSGSPGGAVRLFQVVLVPEQGSWRVVSVGVMHGS